MKNAFINLAIPFIQLTEPAPAPKVKLHNNLTVTLWDRWDINLSRDSTLRNLFETLKNKYQVSIIFIHNSYNQRMSSLRVLQSTCLL